MHRVYDRAGSSRISRYRSDRFCLPRVPRRRHPGCHHFAAQYPAHFFPCQRFAATSRSPTHDSGPMWFAIPSSYAERQLEFPTALTHLPCYCRGRVASECLLPRAVQQTGGKDGVDGRHHCKAGSGSSGRGAIRWCHGHREDATSRIIRLPLLKRPTSTRCRCSCPVLSASYGGESLAKHGHQCHQLQWRRTKSTAGLRAFTAPRLRT